MVNPATLTYEVTLFPDGSGKIVTEWCDEDDNPELRAALNTLESFILAQACLGIDIYSEAYVKAVDQTITEVLRRYE